MNPFTLPPSQPPFAGPELGLVIWLPSYFPHYGPCFPAVCGWHFLSVYLPLVFISTLSSLPSPSRMDASIPHLGCFLDDILTSLDVSLCQVSPIVLPLSRYTSENQVAAQSGTINSWTSTVPGPASAPLHLPCLPPLWLSETLASFRRPLTSPSVAHRSPSTCHQGARLADCTHLSPPEGKMCPFLIYYGLNICTPKFTC